MSTSSLLKKRVFEPRMLIAHLFASIRATSTPGTSRRASGMQVAPERRRSSWRMTKTAAGAFETGSATLETEVTRAVAEHAEVSAYIQRLEQQYDEIVARRAPLPPPQALFKEIEDFLKRGGKADKGFSAN